jgi:outer membrane beta-barrel protein
MESRFRILFLTAAMIGLSGCAATKNLFGFGGRDEPPPSAEPLGQVIEPEVERREIREAKIDRENWEIGAFGGVMSIEDFGTNAVYGVRLAYHLTEGFFLETMVGSTRAGLSSFEVLSGGARLMSDSERDLIYYNLNIGYNVLPGEVFIGEGRALNSSLYLTAGLGSTSFAGDDRFTVNVGLGYRFLITDSIALHVDIRDHMFDIDIIGEEKTAHNLEAHLGFTVFF